MLAAISRAPGAWVDAAPAILGGESPADIPIVVNRRWQIYVNPSLPSRILRNCIKARVP